MYKQCFCNVVIRPDGWWGIVYQGCFHTLNCLMIVVLCNSGVLHLNCNKLQNLKQSIKIYNGKQYVFLSFVIDPFFAFMWCCRTQSSCQCRYVQGLNNKCYFHQVGSSIWWLNFIQHYHEQQYDYLVLFVIIEAMITLYKSWQ